MINDSGLKDSLEKLARNNSTKRIHVTPNIPEKLLKNAAASLEIPSGSNILVLVDDTWTNSGKGGICVTSDAIYWKHGSQKPSLRFDDVEQLGINLGFLTNFTINGQEIPLNHFSGEEIKPFADFLLKILRLEPTEAEPPVETPPDEQAQAVLEKETEAQKTRVESLSKALEDPHTDGNSCLGVVNELAQIGTERALKALFKAFGLGINGFRGRRDLIGLMEVSVNDAICIQFDHAVDKAVLEEAIIRGLDSDEKDVAQGAARVALRCRTRDSRAVEGLISAIDGECLYSQDFAALALESIGEPAVERLNKALEDENKKGVHGRIQEVLVKIQRKRYKEGFSKPDTAK